MSIPPTAGRLAGRFELAEACLKGHLNDVMGHLRRGPAMQRVGFIVLPGFQVMSVGALCVFEFANKEVGEAVYDVHLLSETGPFAARSASASQRSRDRKSVV